MTRFLVQATDGYGLTYGPSPTHGFSPTDNRACQPPDLTGRGIQATGNDVFFYLYRRLTDVIGGVSEQATFDRSPGYGERSGAHPRFSAIRKAVTPWTLGTAQ